MNFKEIFLCFVFIIYLGLLNVLVLHLPIFPLLVLAAGSLFWLVVLRWMAIVEIYSVYRAMNEILDLSLERIKDCYTKATKHTYQ